MSIKLALLITSLSAVTANVPRDGQPFFYHQIVPDVLISPPEQILKVTFPGGGEAQLGNEVTLDQVSGVPTLEWGYHPDRYYTVVFCDPDAPSRAEPEARSFLHWLVVNIPGADVTSGTTLTSILNSHPSPETGLHRYLFLVYEQPGVLDFVEQPDDSFERRAGFSVEGFAATYNLGTAVAGNFYQTQNLNQ